MKLARKSSSKPDSGSSSSTAIGFETGSCALVIHHSPFINSPPPYEFDAVQPMAKRMDDDNGNGFVWYTTGSGKTLTSLKASKLLKDNDSIHKCFLGADRKDVDRQTREDWNCSDKTLSKERARKVSVGCANQLNRCQKGCFKEAPNTVGIVHY